MWFLPCNLISAHCFSIDPAKTPTLISCNLIANKTESLVFWVESSLDLTHDPNMGFLGWGEMGRDKVGSRWNGFSGLRQSGFSGFPLNLVCVLFILGWFFFFLVDFSLIFCWFLGQFCVIRCCDWLQWWWWVLLGCDGRWCCCGGGWTMVGGRWVLSHSEEEGEGERENSNGERREVREKKYKIMIYTAIVTVYIYTVTIADA